MKSHSIVFGTVLLAISNVLSKILALGRDALLARVGGTSLEVDAYNIAFILPDLINHFLGAGLMSITLIPLLIQDVKTPKFNEKLGLILFPVCCLVFISTILAWIFAPQILPHLTDTPLTPSTFATTLRYTRILLFGQVFYVFGGFFLASQYANKQFVFPALAPLVYNGSIVLGGFIGSYYNTLEGFCWGALAGMALGFGVMQYFGALKANVKLQLPKSFFSPLLKRYLWLTLPFIVGVASTFANEFVYRYFGTNEEGGVAGLGFGLRIMMALVGIFGGAVGIASYPHLAKLCADKKMTEVHSLTVNTLEKIICLLLPATIILWIFAKPTVSLYLGSGAFDTESSLLVSQYLKAYLPAAIPMSMALILSRCFYATQSTWRPSILSLSAFALTIPLYAIFKEMGSARVPLVSSINAWLLFTFLLLFWIKLNPSKIYFRLLLSTFKISIPAISIFYFGQFLEPFLPSSNRLNLLLATSVASIILFSLYLLFLLPLRIPGIQDWTKQIGSRLRKG